MQLDFRTLDWKPNPHDHYGATARVPAGERSLLLDAGFYVYHVQGARPRPLTGIIDAIRQGDFTGMEARAVPIDNRGDPVVNYRINSGAKTWIDLKLKDGPDAVNAQLSELAARASDPEASFVSATFARANEREADEHSRRVR